jgi:hypothetical protein
MTADPDFCADRMVLVQGQEGSSGEVVNDVLAQAMKLLLLPDEERLVSHTVVESYLTEQEEGLR